VEHRNLPVSLTIASDIVGDVSNAPTLFTALQEQLGLKLEPSRAPLQALVIDRRSVPLAPCEACRCQPEDGPNRH
jgi:uncharacterized protein (TIGR03435 family)